MLSFEKHSGKVFNMEQARRPARVRCYHELSGEKPEMEILYCKAFYISVVHFSGGS